MMENGYIISRILLFILNPFLSGISALKNIRDGVSHKFLYLWFLIFGIGLCAMDKSADSYRYMEDFIVEHCYSWSEYKTIVSEYFTFDSDIRDIYTLTVNYIVGRFTSNYHWVFLIYASVFGFFYIKSLTIFLREDTVQDDFVFYALLFMFCYSNPIFNINGVRFWTAAWIGVYVTLNIFIVKDYKKIFLLLLMPLIHGSMVLWTVFLAIVFVLSRFQNITIVLFVISSFLSATSYLNLMDHVTEYLPRYMQDMIWSYTESDYALERMDSTKNAVPLYARFLMALPGYFNLYLSYVLIFNKSEINEDEHKGRCLSVMLAFAAITNFLSGIPSMHRFQSMVIPFLVIVWAQNYEILEKYSSVFKLVPVLYAYSLLYWFRYMSSITEIFLYIFPAPLTIIKYLVF